MKRYFLTLVALLTVSCWHGLGAKTSDELRFVVQIVKTQSAAIAHAHVQSESDWERLLAGDELQELDRATTICSPGQTARLHLGNKLPVTYIDPEAGIPQVQYLDNGLSVALQASETTAGIKVRCKLEHMALAGWDTVPLQDGLQVDTVIYLKPGESGVVACAKGELTAKYVKLLFPGRSLSDSDNLLVVLTLRGR